MPPSSLNTDTPPSKQRFLTRADALLLIGMATLVVSLFLVWKREPVPIPPGAQAFLVTETSLQLRGFDMPQWKWMLGCGVTCNLCLLCDPTPRNRSLLAVFQGVAGLGALLFALRSFSSEIGAMVGLVGGAALAWGALNRYQELAQAEETQG